MVGGGGGRIVKQAALLLLCIGTLYGAAWALAITMIYPTADGPMDTRAVGSPDGAVYLNTTRYLVWNRGALRGPSPKILMIGGSNFQAALRLDEVRREVRQGLSGPEVHNLSIGGMNITQMRQVLDLAYEAAPAATWRKTTFVIAISYALFVHDGHHWPTWERATASRVELEMLRFGLYRKQAGKFIVAIPPLLIPEFAVFLRPYFVLARLRVDVTSKIKALFARSPQTLGGDISKADAMKMWDRYMGVPDGRLVDEQFHHLVSLAQRVTAKGGRLVIVDMPLPRWHMDRSPYFRDYQQRKIKFLKTTSSSDRVTILNFQDMDDDADYRDSGHVNQAGAIKLSRRLGAALARIKPAESRPNR